MVLSIFNVVYYFFIFIAGCFFGSFFKVVADRTVNGESIVVGRSKCDKCKKPLGPLNLIPVISYIFQKGKCSNCGKHFSILYPVSEIVTGLLFFSTAYYLDLFNNFNNYALLYFAYLLIIVSFYIVMTFSDISYFIIPDKVVYTAISIAFGFLTLNFIFDIYELYQGVMTNPLGKYLIQAGFLKEQLWYLLKDYTVLLGTAFLIGLFFFSLIVITKGKGMGGGDVKLGFLIGLFNGSVSPIYLNLDRGLIFLLPVLGIFLGFIFGSVFSLFLIALRKKTVKDIIPFGPFLIAGSLVALFFGDYIINWYFGLM